MHANQELSSIGGLMSSRMAKSMETMDSQLIFRAVQLGSRSRSGRAGGYTSRGSVCEGSLHWERCSKHWG
jgi:hypothetical protein